MHAWCLTLNASAGVMDVVVDTFKDVSYAFARDSDATIISFDDSTGDVEASSTVVSDLDAFVVYFDVFVDYSIRYVVVYWICCFYYYCQ